MSKKFQLSNITLLILLAGFSSGTWAKDSLECDDMQCHIDGHALLSLKAKKSNLPTSRHMINLPNNGLIWATEDFNIGQAELSISGPSNIAFTQGKITKPITFYIRSNYSAFVSRYEISIYRESDTDLIDPIAVLPVNVKAIASTDWNGDLPSNLQFRVDDKLVYVLRAYNKQGQFDETFPQSISLVTPETEERGSTALQNSLSSVYGKLMSKEDALNQNLVDNVMGSNDLFRQNIPFNGARVKIQGSNIPEGSVYIDGESYPIDLERKFNADFILPIGEHKFDIIVSGEQGQEIKRDLIVNVTGNSMFLTALADLTVYQNNASGAGKDLALNSRKENVLADGRLAFYMKNKIDGRLTITAQADTSERDIKHLFSGFGRANPEDIFRELDPDYYYPTYGDDSSVYRDVDSMGRFYIRADWDKSQALWGNYNTNIAGTEYARYTRSLYGAALNWRSMDNNEWGDAKSTLKVFGSEAQSAPGHSEFLGTGGSLYYLRHANILSGSDKVQVEVRDKLTGRVEGRVDLVRNVDYEIHAIQGRIILSTPLSQIVRQNLPSIIQEGPLDGFEQRLIVDYEWIPSEFDNDSITAGVRGKHWFNDHIAVGGTYVDENQAGNDYTIKGVDLTLQAGQGTYLKTEFTQTKSTGVPIFYSKNGGLSFIKQNNTDPSREGDAIAVEGRVNFKEIGFSKRDVAVAGWWRTVDAGFSNSNNDTGEAITEHGTEFSAEFTDDLQMYARMTEAKRGGNRYTQSQLTGAWRFSDTSTLTGEIKQVETEISGAKAKGTLAAVQYNERLTDSIEIYGKGQVTVSNGDGEYKNNDAATIGAKYYYGDLSSIGVEGTTGSRGHSALVNAEHKLSDDHTIYTSYTFAETVSDYDSVFGNDYNRNWTIGQRWRLTEKLNMFNEYQSLKGNAGSGESGTANTLGLDYLFESGLSAGLTFQKGKLTSTNGGEIDRTAVSTTVSITNRELDWSSKVEYRYDTGAEHRRQWVTTNRLSWKANEDLRLSTKFDYSKTRDVENKYNEAEFTDSALGFAYRPHDNNKIALFGRYNYFYNLSPTSQENNGAYYDQKSHIFSFEGVYKLNAQWELGGKVAQRKGEVRVNNIWYDSTATFAALQMRYDLQNKWHVMGEYRQLRVSDDSVKQGGLISIERDITENIRLGVGYNFTDFSDDLKKFDYKYKGVFINLVGYY